MNCPKCGAEAGIRYEDGGLQHQHPKGRYVHLRCYSIYDDQNERLYIESTDCIKRQLSQATAALARVRELVDTLCDEATQHPLIVRTDAGVRIMMALEDTK
jgi:hypothetical protein